MFHFRSNDVRPRRDADEHLIWTEREELEEDPYVLRVRLAELIGTESGAENFLDTDPDLQIARLCEVLRIPRPTPSAHAVSDGHQTSDLHPRAGPGDDGTGEGDGFRSSA